MTTISFRCQDCRKQFVATSNIYRTAQKQLHWAGWHDRMNGNHVERLCPDCWALSCDNCDHCRRSLDCPKTEGRA